MKKCPICGNGKARRRCARQGQVDVCSICCASIRGADCGECEHYGVAQQYQAARHAASASRAALREGEFLIEINPEVERSVDEALALAERGKTRQARQTLTRLLREHPRNHNVCFGMGVLHIARGEPRKAIEWFDQAIGIFPYLIEAHFNKAVAYKNLMDLPNCIRALRKVVELGGCDDPETKQARTLLDDLTAGIREQEGIGLDTYLAANDHFQRAVSFMERGEWQDALDGFRKTVALNGLNVASHGNLGLCCAHLGLKANALAELDRALELDPGYKLARSNRKLVQQMTEGQPLKTAGFRIINSLEERFQG